MDPNANLEEQRELAKAILESHSWQKESIQRLAELVQALDEWLTDGGFLPEDWNKLCRDSS